MKNLIFLAFITLALPVHGQNKIIGLEYWYDQLDVSREYLTLTSNSNYLNTNQDLSSLNVATGYHMLNLRLKDADGTWSSVTSKRVYIHPATENLLNKIRIWSDQSSQPADLFTLPIIPAVKFLTISNVLDLCQIDNTGSQKVFFQLGDNNGNWSSVVSKTVNVDVVGQPPSTIGDIMGDSIICFNHANPYTVNLAQGAASYNWSTPILWQSNSNFNSLEIIPDVNDGIIQVYAANACGTSNTSSLSIEVNTAIPAQTDTIFGELKVCAGDQVTYSINTIPDANEYLWDVPPGWTVENNSPLTSITVGVGPGSGDIKVTAMNACGNSETSIIHVEVTPQTPQTPIIDGPLFVCTDSLISYTVPSDPLAELYHWTFPIEWSVYDSISPNNFQFLTAGAGGQISVATENICGLSEMQTITVQVSQNVPLISDTITGLIYPCEGDQVWYELPSGIDALNYYWEWPNDWLPLTQIDSNIIQFEVGFESGLLSVHASNSCGNSEQIGLNIEVPIIDSTIDQNGDTLLVQPNPNATYQWFDCVAMDTISQAHSFLYIPLTTGDYAVITSLNNCISTSDCFHYVISAIHSELSKKLEIYPNPFDDYIIVSNSHTKILELKFIDLLGNQVPISSKIYDAKTMVNIPNIPKGIYFIQIFTHYSILTFPILKE